MRCSLMAVQVGMEVVGRGNMVGVEELVSDGGVGQRARERSNAQKKMEGLTGLTLAPHHPGCGGVLTW